MDKFADCIRRGARSATKLYNPKFVQGTRDEEMRFGVCYIAYNYLSVINFFWVQIMVC